MGPEDQCDTGSEASMRVASVSKAWKILIALVACLMAVATTVCLVHTDGIGEAPTAHQGHRIPPRPPAHITLDLHCLLAILPTVVVLVWLCLGTFYFPVLLSHPLVPSFPPLFLLKRSHTYSTWRRKTARRACESPICPLRAPTYTLVGRCPTTSQRAYDVSLRHDPALPLRFLRVSPIVYSSYEK